MAVEDNSSTRGSMIKKTAKTRKHETSIEVFKAW
jgi:hypothetical protein